jgi:thioesterase domain-containing protein
MMQQRLQEELYQTIPLVRALAPTVTRAAGGIVCFRAPLQENINDKGCVFGGSLSSLLTLACWGVLRVETWAQDLAADIFVHTSSIVYRAPIWTDFDVHAELAPTQLADFLTQFRDTGKAAAIIHSQALIGDQIAAKMEARYVAMRPKT